MEHESNHQYELVHHSEESGVKIRKKIWVIFWVLLAVTISEILLTYTGLPRPAINTMLITMTIVKAFCIVAFYMHLIDEVRTLILVIIVPYTCFILYLLFITITEANYINWVHKIFG